MRYLVTGGAGFLGINMIRLLLDQGQEVTSLDIAPFDYPEQDKIREVVGDIRDEAKVNEALENVDVVIHTAAALPLYKKSEIFSIDIDGTRNVIELAHQKGVKRFVHISSTAVYGVPDHHPLFESDPMIGVGPYGEAKIEAENVCVEYRNKDMCVAIVRPKSFIGPERLGVFAMLYDWAKDGHNFPMVGFGKNRYQLLDVEDLCDAIYLCCTMEAQKVNDTFNIGAKDFTTMKEDFQVVLDDAGHGKRIIGFPAGPVIWTLRVLEFFKLSPLYKWVYETACEDSFVSIDKAAEVLGFTPKYSNKDALLRNYHWYLDNLENFQGRSGISHRVPWKQGILGLIKKIF